MASSASDSERLVESKTKRRKKAMTKSHVSGIMARRSVMRAAFAKAEGVDIPKARARNVYLVITRKRCFIWSQELSSGITVC